MGDQKNYAIKSSSNIFFIYVIYIKTDEVGVNKVQKSKSREQFSEEATIVWESLL